MMHVVPNGQTGAITTMRPGRRSKTLTYFALVTLNLLTLSLGQEALTAIQLDGRDKDHLTSSTTTGTGTATIAQICSSKTGGISSLCRPCICDPVGSESSQCDKYTRRCTCRIGYTGNTCNKCSFDYFNSTTIMTEPSLTFDRDDGRKSTTSNQTSWHCASCGHCFQQWRQNVTLLKERAINLIERAYKLDQSFSDQLGISSSDNRKLAIEGNHTSLSDLDNSLKKVGNQILEAKQRSDQLNILNSELNSTLASYQIAQENMETHKDLSRKVDDIWQRVDYQLQMQFSITSNLDGQLESFKRDVQQIQELIPKSAIKLIRSNRNRTHLILNDLHELDRRFSPPLNESIKFLMHKQEMISFSQRQMNLVGLRVINESIQFHLPQYSAYDGSNKLIPQETLNLELFHDQITMLKDSAKSLADLNTQQFDAYQANYETRSLKMQATRSQIEEAKSTLTLAGQQLTVFEDNLTSIEQLITSIINTSSNNFAQMMDEVAQMIRASLDKIEVKQNTAYVDAADLKSRSLKLNETSQLFTSLTAEINRALNLNLPNLIMFEDTHLQADDLQDVADLKARTKLLAENVPELGQKLLKLSELKQEKIYLVESTKGLNINIKIEVDKIIRLTSELDVNLTGSTAKSHPGTLMDRGQLEDLRSLAKSLTQDSNSVLNRARDYKTKSMGLKMVFDRLIKHKTERLNNITQINGEFSEELDRRLAELFDCTRAMMGVGDTTSLNVTTSLSRVDKLRNRTRLADVMINIKQISTRLYQDLAKTQDLRKDFDEHQRVFAEQRVTIDALHHEMDSITVDLKKKYDYYENCPSSS